MTIFYNYSEISKCVGTDYTAFMQILRYRHTKVIDKKYRNLLSKIKSKGAGHSFLLNPLPLIDDNTDILYKMQYVSLASMRDYTLYSFYGIKALPMSYFPHIDISKIKHNPLLVVRNNNIYFRYEELLNGN